MPDHDNVSTSSAVYPLTSRTVKSGAVPANTNACYLGSVIDPETRAKTTCSFLAQFHVSEGYRFPERDKMVVENGSVVADSCDLRIYMSGFSGDSLATMKLRLQELGATTIMEEDKDYDTATDPTPYLSATPRVDIEQTYAVKDLTRADSLTDGTEYLRSVVVRLPAAYGSYILNKYYDNPDNFLNSYRFIRNVCPGFYVQHTGGVGAMLNVKVSTLNVYFRYHTLTDEGKDTIIDGMQRAAATEEVLQNTQVATAIPDALLDNTQGYTYVKSPAGLFTEIDLPVDDIVGGEHYADTINNAKLLLRRLNSSLDGAAALLPPPTTLLLIPKASYQDFFAQERLADNAHTFLSTYNETTGGYLFGNISKLLTLLKIERDEGAGVAAGDSPEVRADKYAAWEAAHPDWNKMLLVPVRAEYNATTNAYGQTTQSLLRVRSDLSLSSCRLEGGDFSGLELSVIYSRFN